MTSSAAECINYSNGNLSGLSVYALVTESMRCLVNSDFDFAKAQKCFKYGDKFKIKTGLELASILIDDNPDGCIAAANRPASPAEKVQPAIETPVSNPDRKPLEDYVLAEHSDISLALALKDILVRGCTDIFRRAKGSQIAGSVAVESVPNAVFRLWQNFTGSDLKGKGIREVGFWQTLPSFEFKDGIREYEAFFIHYKMLCPLLGFFDCPGNRSRIVKELDREGMLYATEICRRANAKYPYSWTVARKYGCNVKKEAGDKAYTQISYYQIMIPSEEFKNARKLLNLPETDIVC